MSLEPEEPELAAVLQRTMSALRQVASAKGFAITDEQWFLLQVTLTTIFEQSLLLARQHHELAQELRVQREKQDA